MAIENSASSNFWSTFVDSTNVFNCCLSGVSFRDFGTYHPCWRIQWARSNLWSASSSTICVCKKRRLSLVYAYAQTPLSFHCSLMRKEPTSYVLAPTTLFIIGFFIWLMESSIQLDLANYIIIRGSRVRTGLKSIWFQRVFLKSPWKLNMPWKVLENHSNALIFFLFSVRHK